MKKTFFCLILVVSGMAASAQNVGLSFSYFVPRNGYFSTPVSPFSFRSLGVNLNRFLAVQTGVTVYRMSGLSMIDLPLKSNDPFVGPNFTLFVPAELVFQLKGSRVEFDIKGGGFFFYGADQKLNSGNIDKAIREMEGWTVANSNLSFENHPGFGWQAGMELTINVTDQVGISLETNYLAGQSKMPLKGSYSGGITTIGVPTPVDYKDAKVDFTGLEFSVGLIFSTGGGSGKPARKKR